MSLEKFKKGNKTFIKQYNANKHLYNDLVKNGQHPKVLWVGCSDSRVVPEFIVNANAGDLFVTRNIANVIPPSDVEENNSCSVLEYAVNHLEVEHIIICGHTGCGGINAALDGTEEGTSIHKWLQHTSKAIHLTKDLSEDSRELAAIKENVKLQANNLLTFDFIKAKFDQKILFIHKWLYDINSGKIYFYSDDKNEWYNIY